MTLEEAIAHSEEKANDISVCEECRAEHKQLSEWLKELKMHKERANELVNILLNM